jgi:hypothetical protein
MNAKEKALALSYLLSNLLIQNIEVATLEFKDDKSNDYGKLNDKLIKLKSASKNAFMILERNVSGDLEEIQKSIEIVLDNMWE